MKKSNILLALSAVIVSLSYMNTTLHGQRRNTTEVGIACLYNVTTSESAGATGAWTAGAGVAFGIATDIGITAASTCNPVGLAVAAAAFAA